MDTESFLATASELLAIPSTSDRPDQLRRALDFVLGYAGSGHTIETFESGGKPSALLYRDAQRPRFRVILNAHLDVVPGTAAEFRPRRDGNRLYARGAQDMKVTALLQALAFRELAGTLPYPLGLQLVTDEETGGRDGTLHQVERGVTGEFVIIGETSGLRIVTESKGVLRVTLHATGRGAHGAYPWLGDNALVKLHQTVSNVLAAYPVPAAGAWRTTVSLARIETSNQARNQIPADARAWLDIRVPAGDADLDGKSGPELTTYLESFCVPGVTVVVESHDPAHRTDTGRPEVAALQRAAQAQGYSGEFLRKHGSGDSRFYGARGINSVAFGTGGDGQHGPGEYLDITTIRPYYLALTAFLRELVASTA
jgi:succinyl-diaminopimelate desuccinylase